MTLLITLLMIIATRGPSDALIAGTKPDHIDSITINDHKRFMHLSKTKFILKIMQKITGVSD